MIWCPKWILSKFSSILIQGLFQDPEMLACRSLRNILIGGSELLSCLLLIGSTLVVFPRMFPRNVHISRTRYGIATGNVGELPILWQSVCMLKQDSGNGCVNVTESAPIFCFTFVNIYISWLSDWTQMLLLADRFIIPNGQCVQQAWKSKHLYKREQKYGRKSSFDCVFRHFSSRDHALCRRLKSNMADNRWAYRSEVYVLFLSSTRSKDRLWDWNYTKWVMIYVT